MLTKFLIGYKECKSAAGRPQIDVVLMFKIIFLQRYYGLGDHQIQYQIIDRTSFRRFLGIRNVDEIPDEKTQAAKHQRREQADQGRQGQRPLESRGWGQRQGKKEKRRPRNPIRTLMPAGPKNVVKLTMDTRITSRPRFRGRRFQLVFQEERHKLNFNNL